MKRKCISVLLVLSMTLGVLSPSVWGEDTNVIKMDEIVSESGIVDDEEIEVNQDEDIQNNITQNDVSDIFIDESDGTDIVMTGEQPAGIIATDVSGDDSVGAEDSGIVMDTPILGAGEGANQAAEQAAANVKALIDALPSKSDIEQMSDATEITNTKNAVNDAREAYDALSVISVDGASATGLIEQYRYDKLRDCELGIINLDNYIEEARTFTTQVGHLPAASEITLNDEAELADLEAKAEALSDNARNRVDASVFQHLTDARAKITLLKNQQEQETAEDKIDDYIDNNLQPLIDSGEYTDEQQQQIQDIIDELRRQIEELVNSGAEISQSDIDALIADAQDQIANVPTVHHVAAQNYEAKLKAFKSPDALTLQDEASVQALLDEYNGLSDKAKTLVKADYMNPGETYKDRLDALKNKISDLRTELERAKKEAKAYVHNGASITPNYYTASGISESYNGIDGMILSNHYDATGNQELDQIRDTADSNIDDPNVIDIATINQYRDAAVNQAKTVRDAQRKQADAFEAKINSFGLPIDLSRNKADDVVALRKEYNALPSYAKKYIDTDKTGTGETYAKRIEALEARIDKMATDDANAFAQQVAALPALNDITPASEGQIGEVRKSYESLTKEAKAKVSPAVLQKLVDAEKRLALEKEKVRLKDELNQFVKNKKAKTTYEADQLALVNKAQSEGLSNIGKATSSAAAVKALNDAKAKINGIETKAQRMKKRGVKIDFNRMCFRSTKQTKYTIWLRWKQVSNIVGYQLYRKSGNSNWKMIRQYDYSARSGKDGRLDPGKKYTYKLVAFDVIDGEIIPIAESVPIYVMTKGGKKPKSNVKQIKIKKVGKKNTGSVRHTIKYKLKKGKTAKIKFKEVKTSGAKLKRIRKVKYESTNPKIATVSSSGKIKGVSKGVCWIRVYSQTGTYRSIQVTVK